MRLLGAARGLRLEALLDQAKLEHGRLLRIGIDEQRVVAVREELGADVLAHDHVLEEIDEVRVEDRLLEFREDPARLRGHERFAIRVARVLREIRVRVRDREDARAERDVLAGDAVRETFAVVALVHLLDRRRRVSREKWTDSTTRAGVFTARCAAVLWPSYSLAFSAVRWNELILPMSCKNAAATIAVIVEGATLMRSSMRRVKRAACAEWPRRSGRLFSSKLTRTLSSSRSSSCPALLFAELPPRFCACVMSRSDKTRSPRVAPVPASRASAVVIDTSETTLRS